MRIRSFKFTNIIEIISFKICKIFECPYWNIKLIYRSVFSKSSNINWFSIDIIANSFSRFFPILKSTNEIGRTRTKGNGIIYR